MRAEQTSFLFGANAPFIEELYERYLGDPNAVDAEWRTFFEALGEQKGDVLAEVRGASWAPNRGHLEADLDPLGLVRHSLHRELDPATYGFGEGDWDRPILIFGTLGLGESATLRQIWDRLRKTYCGKIGVEYMHISDPDQKAWIQERIEHVENRTEFTP